MLIREMGHVNRHMKSLTGPVRRVRVGFSPFELLIQFSKLGETHMYSMRSKTMCETSNFRATKLPNSRVTFHLHFIHYVSCSLEFSNLKIALIPVLEARCNPNYSHINEGQ